MSSSVFYKFKSQKEPSRVEFDGTGISVWELKRDIIKQSGLGDGTDFDLFIYAEDYSEEYSDDTTIIPRSTTVVARRQPATKPGAGRAARYVTGKMPVNARNSSRREQHTKVVKPSTAGLEQMSTALTEEEKLAAIFQVQSDQWQAQQEEMAHQAPVHKAGAKKPANVPDHDPPNGYVCFRCGRKGHWIQVCPTNDDPEFDNKPRVKRTTGIPRSFLKTVDKSALQQNEGEDGVKPLAGLMVNAEGDYVIAEPDKASWEQFQAKTKTSAAAQKAASEEDKELEEKGLLCAVDKKLFIDPMMTPCCEKTYCNDCITNALIESDFVCPACQTEGVLIDDLKPDEEASKKIQEHLKEKEIAKTKERSKSPTAAQSPKQASPVPNEGEASADAAAKKPETSAANAENTDKTKSPTPSTAQAKSPQADASKQNTTPNPPTNGTSKAEAQNATTSKKRPADELLENPKIPKAPKAMQKAQAAREMQQNMMGGMMPNMMMNPMMGMNGMNGMNGFPNMPMGMPMGMPMMPNMGMNMMNPMMGMNGFNQGGFPNMNGGFGNFGGNMGMGNNNHNNNMNGFQHQHPNRANFTQPSNDEDAYFRKPVNPGRHQNRQRRNRPSDYREL